ncbi:uncharacterized protein [Physcomitrium patens]|uniref:Pectinesterase inhibitor domain-containing protein n=1 Tax=Physcomitrium patens TaxID=3218 RepID=A0A2K1J0W7_PHYPA|nr:pectinesterase inhibitor 6-like [Physcomitrium patens]XP_024401720.1 pectinesterase inhibitor 6-like [Physcomitrium patens]PNR35163.1 hypothetical protein PHYPA_023062 [Physcomitrium patens]|eukprot:XP_024401719.1 pectinesterase inhibitor 6-like [Physcomitrella patens]
MMRLEDSRGAGLLSSSTQYASLETSLQMSEFDVPMSRRSKGRSRCYAVSFCIVLIAVAAIVSGTIVGGKKNAQDTSSDSSPIRHEHGKISPAPSPIEDSGYGDGWASSPPAPTIEASSDPVSSPKQPPSPSSQPSPSPSPSPSRQSPSPSISAPPPAFGPSTHQTPYDQVRYETICNKTIDPTVCLTVFASNPNSKKVDLQQWTLMSMEAASHAMNESLILAQGLAPVNPDNAALQQCIEVFSEALDLVNISMHIIAGMDAQAPGTAGTDALSSMSAAMTNQDTCQEGIDDLGPFPGSDKITGDQAKHVNKLLSIALTFVNELTGAGEDPNNHHRRLLQIKSSLRRTILSRQGLS